MSDFRRRVLGVCGQIAQGNREVPEHMREDATDTELGWAVAEILYLMGDTSAEDMLLWDGSFYPTEDEARNPGTGWRRCEGHVIGVTSSHVYLARADKNGDMTTEVRPLALKGLTLTALQVNLGSMYVDEPYMPEVDLDFHDGTSLHLPIQPGATDETHRSVARILPVLRKAVTR